MLQPDLLSPSACAPANLPESLTAVDSPLITQDWTKWLAVFPDARLDDSLLRVFKLVGCIHLRPGDGEWLIGTAGLPGGLRAQSFGE